MAASFERRDDRQPDGAAADHQARLTGFEAGEPHGMLAHGQGFGQRGHVAGEGVGHREQEDLLEGHVLGQGARVEVGVADLLDPGGPEDDRHRADPGADGERPGGVGAVLDDLGAELVPEDAVGAGVECGDPHRFHQPGEVGEVRQRVQVGAADPGGQRPHDHMARARCHVGYLGNHQLAGPGHRSSHGCAPSGSLERSPSVTRCGPSLTYAPDGGRFDW